MPLFTKESRKLIPPRTEARQKTFRIRASDLEQEDFRQAAAVLNHTAAAWARGVLRREATAILVEAGKKKREL